MTDETNTTVTAERDDFAQFLSEQTEGEYQQETCDVCGESDEGLMAVTYDAMVDGPGFLITELVCVGCRKKKP